jgi:hypothetical protein
MTELSIRPEEIRDAIEKYVSSYTPETSREEVGRVIETGDGIARVEGLQSAMTNELLEFEGGLLGLALNLDEREIGCVILGDAAGIEEGQEVRRTGEVLSAPVGDGFLGRVVDPLGNPLDGKGDIVAEGRRILELQAPTVVQRQPVTEPLQTGLKAVDAMTPVGRGQHSSSSATARPARPRSRSTPSSTSARTGRAATRRSRSSASTSPSARRGRRSRSSSTASRRPARWSTPPSSPLPRASRPA